MLPRFQLRWLLVGMILFALGACGFKPAVSWSKLDGPVDIVSAQPYSSIERELTQLVNQSLAEFDQIPTGKGTRRIELGELETKTEVLAVDSNGRPAEYRVELIQPVHFTIDDNEIATEFSQRRDYVFDVRDILAYQQQVEQLKATMSARLAQQIIYDFAIRLQTGGGS